MPLHGQVKKMLAAIRKTESQIKINILYYELLDDFSNTLMHMYERLKSFSFQSRGLINMFWLIESFVSSDEFNEIKECIQELNDLKQKATGFNLVFNCREDANVISVANKEHIRKAHEASGNSESITSKMNRLMDFILNNFNWEINVYQDVEYTALETVLVDKLKQSHPEFIEKLAYFYEKYKGFGIDRKEKDPEIIKFILLAEDMYFYLGYVRFMDKYREKGFGFSCPEIWESTGKTGQSKPGQEGKPGQDKKGDVKWQTEVRNAYDLGLAVSLYKEGKDSGSIICNDYRFSSDNRFFILTGPNQGGKTTFLRSVGIVQVLAQAGCFVPSDYARLEMVDNIFTHFAAAEATDKRTGRFDEEISHVSQIFNSATSNSLVLLNEAFISTRRAEAVDVALRVIGRLLEKGCCGGYVTHFYEILHETKGMEGVFNLFAEAIGNADGSGIRTYKIVASTPSYSAYARDIARKCGVSFEQLMALVRSKE